LSTPIPETTKDYKELRSCSPASPENDDPGQPENGSGKAVVTKGYKPERKPRQIKRPKTDIPEPTYGDPGDEFGDHEPVGTTPKWATPETPLAIRALHACGRTRYKKVKGKGEKTQWKVIEKAMMPLTGGITSKYPTEWVENRIEIAENMNGRKRGGAPFTGGVIVTFPNLLKSIQNEEKKIDWVAKAEERVTVDSLEVPEGVVLGEGMQETDQDELERYLEQERQRMLA